MFYSSPKTSNIFSIEENIFSAQWKMISILSKFLTVLKAWKPKKKKKFERYFMPKQRGPKSTK